MIKLKPDHILQAGHPANNHLPTFIDKDTPLALSDCFCVLRTHLSEELDMKDWCISDSTPE
jgi:hypothetical protein